MQSYWFSKQSKINIIYNISVIPITITMSIILANFGKYAISDCPFIVVFFFQGHPFHFKVIKAKQIHQPGHCYHFPQIRHHSKLFNTLRPRQNEQHFADDILKRIFFNENVWISIKVSLIFVPKGLVNNIPALVKIMAWRRSGDKPLSEPMRVSLPTHICVTRPQWVKCISYSKYIHKFSKFHFNVDLKNKSLSLMPTSFLKETCCQLLPGLVDGALSRIAWDAGF